MKPVQRELPAQRHREGRLLRDTDSVAEEVPIALEYNGIAHAVMLASPADLEDFALGFSFTEEIVARASEVRDIRVVSGPAGITVQLEIASARFAGLKERRRALAGRTGCGLCGIEQLSQAVRRPAPLQSSAQFDAPSVCRALASLRSLQPLHDATGATHAAAFAQADGELLLVREDVGRHNALDKLVGALLRDGIGGRQGFIAVTSRASYEMAAKTARAGVPLLAAISGVTGLAVDVAQECGLCLTGFVRGESLTVYTVPERIASPGDESCAIVPRAALAGVD